MKLFPHVHLWQFVRHGVIGNAWPTTVKKCRCGVYKEIPWPREGKPR